MDQELLTQAKDKMKKAVEVLKEDLSTIRTGRANPALVENIVVSTYERTATLKLKELATITTEGPTSLIVSPFDQSIIKDIQKAIDSAKRGFQAVVDGQILRIKIPSLTEERRQEFIRLANTKVEGGRIMVRQVRHEAMAIIKRQFEAKEISEDDKFRLEKEIQKVTDEMMEEIEAIRKTKEAELSEV